MKLIFSKKIKVELFLERVVPGEEDTGKWLFDGVERRQRRAEEKNMKLQYIGDSFRDGLTDGKYYDGKEINIFCVALIDDSGVEKIYSRINPGPFAGRVSGRWEIA